MSELQPHEVGPGGTPGQEGLGYAWCLAVAMFGGLLCYSVMNYFGEMGALSLYLLGWLAGLVGRRIVTRSSRGVAWGLVVAVGLAMVVMIVTWIRCKTEQGQAGWGAAVEKLPAFVKTYRVATGVSLLSAGLGAHAGFRQLVLEDAPQTAPDSPPGRDC